MKLLRFVLLFVFVTSWAQSSVYDGYPLTLGESERVEFEWTEGLRTYVPEPPVLQAPIAILFEQVSGVILYEKDIDRPIPPASLTKLMTIHLLRIAAEENGLGFDDLVTYSSAAFAENAPPQSSLMFLESGHRTTLRDLLLGLAISSGNDAAVAAAEIASGSVQGFVADMNDEARRLGLEDTYFEEPSGYSPFNQTTARDFARFLGYYLHRWPESLGLYHSVLEFTYPRRENLDSESTSRFLGITQPNRNGLVGTYPGVDGLKTGFIDESGYNLAFTAVHDDFRVVGVILGVQAPSTPEGSRIREADARALLDYSFQHFVSRTLVFPSNDKIRLWKAEQRYLLLPETRITLVVPRSVPTIEIRRTLPGELQAPLFAQSFLTYQELAPPGGPTFARLPLKIKDEVLQARGIRLQWDRLVLYFREIFGVPQPLVLSDPSPALQ